MNHYGYSNISVMFGGWEGRGQRSSWYNCWDQDLKMKRVVNEIGSKRGRRNKCPLCGICLSLSLLLEALLFLLSQFAGLGLDISNAANHVESNLGLVIVLATKNFPEAADGVVKLDELTLLTSERSSDGKRLGEETLDLTGTSDGELIFLRQFIHTQDGNDILERLVVLKNLLDVTSALVVLVTDDSSVKDTGGRVKGIDGRVDTQFGNTTRKHSGGIQVSKSGGRGRIGQIISRHVDSLDGGDGTKVGGCDTLLKGTHVRSEGGLVTDSGWDTTKKGRHLRTGLSEAENVVNEEEDITTTACGGIGQITKGLGDSETSQGDTGTGTRGLVHLTVHQGDLGLAFQLDNTTFNHFMVQIVTLASAFTDTSKHRETRVSLGDVVDQLHDKHSLADTSTTEKTNLATLSVRSKEINDLDTSLEDFRGDTHFGQRRGLSMDGKEAVGLDGTTLINGFTNDVHDTAKGSNTDGDGDGITTVNDGLTADKTLSTVHGNSTHGVLAEMLSNLKNQAGVVVLDLKGVEDRRKSTILELDVDNGTDNGDNGALGLLRTSSHSTGSHV
eukprot:m.33042 g.33042  ORF g.33042 m.33042 type:complete len:558 (+) comp10850_c1_seq1:312-1985(+)